MSKIELTDDAVDLFLAPHVLSILHVLVMNGRTENQALADVRRVLDRAEHELPQGLQAKITKVFGEAGPPS